MFENPSTAKGFESADASGGPLSDVLVIGGSGLLGQHLVEEARVRNLPVQATYAGAAIPGGIRMELADLEGAIRTLVRLRPKVVLLAAAMTDVDGCESHPEQAAAINAEAPGEIAKACASLGARLVHFSTDYVFEGSTQAACETFRLPETLLKPIRLADLPLKAPRPLRSCLATARIERVLKIRVPTFADSLADMRDHEPTAGENRTPKR